jgi:hypothetical protein
MTNLTCSRSRMRRGSGVAQFALVDAGGGARLSRFAGADLAAFASPARPVKLRKLLPESRPDVFGVCRDQGALCAEHPIGPRLRPPRPSQCP